MIVRTFTFALAALLLAALVAHAAPPADLYAEYGKALKTYVDDNGLVYYRGLKANPQDLVKFLSRISAVDAGDFAKWSKDEQIAFWINAYNGITLKAIIDHYPIKKSGWFSRFPDSSIRQIDGVWDKLKWNVLGRRMTLEDIEHKTLRKQFNEPRIHVALVCAAMGCPKLRNEPYVGARLDAQLTDQSEAFVRNREKFRIDTRAKVVHMSSIFKWFGGDFVKTYGRGPAPRDLDDDERATLNFALTHLPDGRRPRVTEDYDIKYLSYDWALNERKTAVE